MNDFAGSVFWLIVSLGILVTFHEFGHFWVARRFGVKVLRFSIGFGKPLWMRRGKDGTEYAIAAIPLGGYVKMLDEREGDVAASELDRAFNRKSVWKRIAIVIAGPAANLLLCVAFLWAMFVIGRPDYAPEIGRVEGIAATSGFERGDRILAIGERETPSWSEAGMALVTAAIDRTPVQVEVEDASGQARMRTLQLERLGPEVKERDAIGAIGLRPAHAIARPVVGDVAADGPAAGKLKAGDRITAIDGRAIINFESLPAPIEAAGKAGRSAHLTIERAGQSLAFDITPRRLQRPNGGEYWGIGIAADRSAATTHTALLRLGPLQAIPAAFRETGRLASDSLGMLKRMVLGRASLENVSGPVTIARYANATADMGPAWFLNFLALVSLSLAIINLLPIPMLDGGHLLYYLIELAKGRPLGERAMAIGQYFGLAFLACLMGLAFYNDLHGLLR